MRAPEPAGQDPSPPDLPGFEHRLRAAFDAAATDILAPAPSGAAVIARRRHQRRTVTAAVAAAAAVALVTGGVTALTGSTRHAAPAVVPAHVEPETKISLYGVTFGWLPPGVARYDDTVDTLAASSNGPPDMPRPGPTISQELKLAPVADVNRALDGGPSPNPGTATTYTVAVLRVQPDPDTGALPDAGIELHRQLDHHQVWSRDWTSVEIPMSPEPGRYLVLLRRKVQPTSPKAATTPPLSYALYIHPTGRDHPDNPAAVIITGPDRATVERIGRDVTVGPQPAVDPAGQDTALAGIRAAARAALTGPAGTGMLTALTAPDRARPALAEALSHPDARIAAIRFADLDLDDDPLFLSPTEAVVTARVGIPTADHRYVAIPAELRLVSTNGQWKVTTASYCAALTPVLRCPTVP